MSVIFLILLLGIVVDGTGNRTVPINMWMVVGYMLTCRFLKC